jgi:hypothetical protein
VKVTGSLRHLFGRVDKKQIPPRPNRQITGATTGVFSASTSAFGVARSRAMKNPARFTRPGFYTRNSAYTFLHVSRYMSRQISDRQISDRQISGRQIFREKLSEKFLDPGFLRTEIFRPGRIVFIHAQSRARRFRVSAQR